jgi:uncharacterized RDD family membrane protein YckC
MAPPKRPPPGLLRRLGAMCYDAVLLTGLLFFATALLLPFRGGEAFRPNQLAYSAYLLGVCFLFHGWFWIHGGQTLGMRAWKIRLCVDDGSAMTWTRAAVRFAAALLSLGLFGLGYGWALWDRRKRCWHDLISGTHPVWQDGPERISLAHPGDGHRGGDEYQDRGEGGREDRGHLINEPEMPEHPVE